MLIFSIIQEYYLLGWLLIDDIIRTRKLSLLHKICNGCGPEYRSSYVNYVKSSHDYNTKTLRRNYLTTPKCKKKKSLRTFHSSATRLWNKTEPSLRDTLSQKRFLRDSKGNKVQCLRKIRPVTPLELWNNAENKRNTNKEHQYRAKNIPVIPRFSRLRRSSLAPRACSHSTVSKEK